MSVFTGRFRRFLPIASRARKPRRPQRVRPTVEALEDRLVPTVAFKPFFGAEGLFNNHNLLSSSDIYPIFWGHWWGDHMDQVAKLTAAFDSLINFVPNAYLVATKQYGTDGKVTFHDTYHDNYIVDTSSNPPAQVDHGSIGINFSFLSNEIEDLIYDAHAVPSPEDLHCDPLYVVITPPGVTSKEAGEEGFNVPGLHHVGDLQWREEVWVSTQQVNPSDPSSPLKLDYSTELFAHEVVEAITSPFGFLPGVGGATVDPGLKWVGDGNHQLADFEPDGRYFYRLGGPGGSMAQAYWSDALQQFVVPDDNSLVVQLVPNWVGSKQGSRGTLQGGSLVIDANQPGIPGDFVGNQQIVIDTVQMPTGPGIEVTLDGQKFDFEDADFANGRITDIQVNTANDTESVLVKGTLSQLINGTPTPVPVTINLGSGNYTIDLGHYSSHALNGDVRINSYRGGNGVVKIDPDVPGAAGVVVANANGNLDVQVEPTGRNLTYVGGQVSIFGGGHTSVEVHDELNRLATAYALTTDGTISLLKTSANGTFALWYTGVTTLSLAGGFGADTYNLSGWVPGQTEQQLSIQTGGWPGSGRSSGANTLFVPSATGTAIAEGVTLDARGTDLTLDDGGAGAAGTYTITAGAVTRDAGGRQPFIRASNFKSLTLWAGPADVVKVQSTQVPTTVIGAGGFDQFTVGTGSDLTVDNHVSYGASTYTITAGALTRDAHGGAAYITVSYAGLKGLTLKTGWGASTVNVESTPAPTTVLGGGGADAFNVGPATRDMGGIGDPLTLDGGPGGASLTVYDQGHANRYPATYTVTGTALTRGEYEPPPKGVIGLPQWQTVTVNYARLSRLELDASDRTPNVIEVESTPGPTWVYGGAGTGRIDLSPTRHNLDDLGAYLYVSGAAPLNVYDQANPHGAQARVPTAYTVWAGGLTRRAASQPVPTGISFAHLTGLALYTSTTPNVVEVDSTPGPTAINSGAADAITVLGGATNLTVNAHGGSLFLDDHLLQNDQDAGGDFLDQVFTVKYGVSDQAVTRWEHEHDEVMVDTSDLPGGGKGTKIQASDSYSTATVNYTNVTSLRLDTGAVDTSVGVWSTPAGAPLTINTQIGDRPPVRKPSFRRGGITANQIQVEVKNLHGGLTLQGSGPNDSLLLDDSAATTPDRVTVTPTQVGAAAADNFFGSGGRLSYSGLRRLTLNLSNANDDVVNLAPSAATAFTINGSPTAFQAGSGARLNLNLTGVTSAVNTPGQPGAGQWTFGNCQAATYTALAVPLSNVTSLLALAYGSVGRDAATGYYMQAVTLTNTSGKPLVGPLSLVLDGLSAGVKLVNQAGTTGATSPAGSPYVNVALAGNVLDAGQSVTVTLAFDVALVGGIRYHSRVLAGAGQR
jgi:hypothetical protein